MIKRFNMCRLILTHLMLMLFFSLSGQASLSLSDLQTPDNTICLSLKILNEMVSENSINNNVRHIGMINYLEGYILDVRNNDIILIGKNYSARPLMTLDDLIVNIRNVWNDLGYPACSLDPYPENLVKLKQIENKELGDLDLLTVENYVKEIRLALGNQKTVIEGVPRNSQHAHTMINADYIMKKYSQGLMPDKSVKSCLSIMEQASESLDNSYIAMSRFWFHISKGDPHYLLGSNIVMLQTCGVEVFTEKQLQTKEGVLYDVEEKDPMSEEFAKSHTQLFPYLALKTPEYASLENLYRLQAVLNAIKIRKADLKTKLNINYLLKSYQYKFETQMPNSLPCLTNYSYIDKSYTDHKIGYDEIHKIILCPIVVGGVSMELSIEDKNFELANDISHTAEEAILARPSIKSLVWNF